MHNIHTYTYSYKHINNTCTKAYIQVFACTHYTYEHVQKINTNKYICIHAQLSIKSINVGVCFKSSIFYIILNICTYALKTI